MNRILAPLALLAFVATPALAQTQTKKVVTHKVHKAPAKKAVHKTTATTTTTKKTS